MRAKCNCGFVISVNSNRSPYVFYIISDQVVDEMGDRFFMDYEKQIETFKSKKIECLICEKCKCLLIPKNFLDTSVGDTNELDYFKSL